MGIADLGVGTSGSYAYNTSEFEGIANLQSFSAFSPGYSLWSETPDWASLQLNAVAVNISRPAVFNLEKSGGWVNDTFWVQDVARFNGTTLQFVDNIWNFSNSSGGGLVGGTIRSGSGLAIPCIFYYDAGPSFRVQFPLKITLNETIFSDGGSPAVRFGYGIDDANGSVGGTFDTVVFNSTENGSAPAGFQVSGGAPNPFGLRNDAELVFGGDGGGANANVEALNGSLALLRWNASSASLAPIPSAYDYGEDAAETSEGVAATYLGTTESLNAGPSFLYGLWNTTTEGGVAAASPGWIHVQLALSDPDGFLFAGNGTSLGYAFASFVPTNGSGAYIGNLPPPLAGAPYEFGGWANGVAANTTTVVAANVSGTTVIDLRSAAGTFDAPVYLHSLADVANLATDGLPGVVVAPGDATLWINATSDALAVPFRQVNDYGAPLFTLFSADEVAGLSIHLSDFLQDPATFSYSHSFATVQLPDWSQGYFLYGGPNGSSVENITTDGPGLGVAPFIDPLPGTVELYDVADAQARSLASNGTGTALVLIEDRDVQVSNISATGNATGILVVRSSGISVSGLLVRGYTWIPHPGTERIPRLSGGGPGVPGAAAVSPKAWSLWPSCPTLAADILVSSVRFAFGPFGLCSSNSTSIEVDHVTVNGGGSWGMLGSGDANVTAADWNVSDNGTAGQLVYTRNVSVFDQQISESKDGGWNFSRDQDVRAWNLTAIGTSTTAVDGANGSADLRFWNITAEADGIGVGGVKSSEDVSVWNVRAENGAFGAIYLGFDQGLTLWNFTATGGSWGATAFWTYNGTVDNFSAVGGSVGYLIDGGSNVSVRDVVASDNSIGVDGTQLSNSSIEELSATAESVGVDLLEGANVSLSSVRAGPESTGVYADGLATSEISGINATSGSIGPSYFISPVIGSTFPVAAVALWITSNVSVSNVTSTDYPFTIWDLVSSNLTVENARSWNGGEFLQSNYTQFSTFSDVFAFGDRSGFELFEPTDVTIEGSTVEDCAGVAVGVFGGLNTTVFGNNFVGNAGASVNGTFDALTPQAIVDGGGTGNFSWHGIGNYWSDWASSAPYVVGPNVSDRFPTSAFISHWLQFQESGLLAGLVWQFDLEGADYPTDQPWVDLPAGILPTGNLGFTVTPPSGWGASPAAGSVAFSGGNQTVFVRFSEPQYGVEFEATGLPNGTAWVVGLGPANASAVVRAGTVEVAFTAPNGSYAYRLPTVGGYRETTVPPNGTLGVDGANVTVRVSYAPVLFAVGFSEVGLAPGAAWSVTLNGTVRSTTTGALVFSEPNGSYPYRISALPGWLETSRPYVGNITVAGANATYATAWQPATYGVVFDEEGLAPGTDWQVTIAGRTVPSTGTNLTIVVANGTYPFQVSTPSSVAYTVSPSVGNVTVDGANRTIAVTFVPVTTSSSGPGEPVLLVIVSVGLAVAVFGVVYWIRRRRPPEPLPPGARIYP
jgi:hypothetical protein